MKILPIQDRVLVKRDESEERTDSGLYIPDTAKEKPSKGIVIAVGAGKRDDDGKRIEPDVKTGDKVLFGKYSGTEIELHGEKHIVLREEEILAVLEE